MATPGSGDKAMSSRLLTMKFMQRGAAASNSAFSRPSGPPSKRVRLSNGSAASSATPQSVRQSAIRAALAAEEEKRLIALERHTADSEETRWVLSVQDPPSEVGRFDVVTVGFGDIDALNDRNDGSDADGDVFEDAVPAPVGRILYGRANRLAPAQAGDHDDSGSSASASESENVDDDDVVTQILRDAKREAKVQTRADREAQQQDWEMGHPQPSTGQPRKPFKLSKLTSISGGGGSGGGRAGGPVKKPMSCHACGEVGHKRIDCPQGQRRR